MKILARASSLTGFVDAVVASQGTIELAGLQIHMEHGAVVNVGDFVDVEATLGADKIWTGRIKAHFTTPGRDDIALSSRAHSGQSALQDSAGPLAERQVSGGAAPDSAPASAAATGASSPAPVTSSPAGDAGAPRTPAAQPGAVTATSGTAASNDNAASPSGTAPASGRRRFGAGAMGGQRTGSAPSALGGGAGSGSRPRFTPSSADEKVQY